MADPKISVTYSGECVALMRQSIMNHHKGGPIFSHRTRSVSVGIAEIKSDVLLDEATTKAELQKICQDKPVSLSPRYHLVSVDVEKVWPTKIEVAQ